MQKSRSKIAAGGTTSNTTLIAYWDNSRRSHTFPCCTIDRHTADRHFLAEDSCSCAIEWKFRFHIEARCNVLVASKRSIRHALENKDITCINTKHFLGNFGSFFPPLTTYKIWDFKITHYRNHIWYAKKINL